MMTSLINSFEKGPYGLHFLVQSFWVGSRILLVCSILEFGFSIMYTSEQTIDDFQQPRAMQ